MQKFIGIALGLLSILLMAATCDVTPPPPNCSAADANGDFASADDISLGQGVKGAICESGDKDFLKIIVSQAGVLEMKLDPVPSVLTMNINFYNASQERVSYSSTGSKGQSSFLEKLVDTGTYYFLLSGSGGESSTEDYTFTVTLDTKDKNELNNAFSTATTLAFATAVTGTIRSYQVKLNTYLRLSCSFAKGRYLY